MRTFLLVARTPVDPHVPASCGAQAWRFDRAGDERVPRGDLDLLVVCG
jgi:hypothetical protein